MSLGSWRTQGRADSENHGVATREAAELVTPILPGNPLQFHCWNKEVGPQTVGD